jgi:hypothetical protein
VGSAATLECGSRVPAPVPYQEQSDIQIGAYSITNLAGNKCCDTGPFTLDLMVKTICQRQAGLGGIKAGVEWGIARGGGVGG